MTSFEGLCQILQKEYQLEPSNLTPGTALKDLAIDSLGVIELIFAIEEKFSVTADDANSDAAKDFNTLQDVSNYIDGLIAERDALASVGSTAVAPSKPAEPTEP